MPITAVGSPATALRAAQTENIVGLAMLRKELDTRRVALATLTQLLPPRPYVPGTEHVGTRLDARV
jgi:hypothetical protein